MVQFGHRTCRYLLWLAHGIAFVVNALLLRKGVFWKVVFSLQSVFYLAGIIGWIFRIKSKWVRFITYYIMTVFAQWKAVYKIIMGKSKATWEKAESTR